MEEGRRAFLQGRRPSMAAAPFRPPWAIAEPRFLDLCSRCNDCIDACPTDLLIQGAGGFPEADFNSAHCTFCGDCRQACQTGALNPTPDIIPWSLLARIGEDCLPRQGVDCRTCGERCDIGAIRFAPRLGGPALPEIDAARCTGCGECVADCPTRAIAVVRPPVISTQGN